MDAILTELLQGLRRLWRDKGFSFAVVLTLALGLGANGAIFAALDAYLLRPLPYPHGARLIRIYTLAEGPGFRLAPPYLKLAKAPGVAASGRFTAADDVTVVRNGRAQSVPVSKVTASLFDTLEASPYLGRLFTSRANNPGGPHEVVLSYRYWQQAFGGDPKALGRSLKIDGQVFQVVGIMPSTFFFPLHETALWLPFALPPNRFARPLENSGGQALVRLLPGASKGSLVAALNVRFDRLLAKASQGLDERITATPLQSSYAADMADKLVLMQLGAALLLLLAAANLGNLGLVRMLGRRHELAVRLALGARRLSLLRLIWLEALPLGLVAAGLGLALAQVGAVALNAYGIAAADTPFTIAFTPPVVLVVFGLALFSTLIALSAPLLLMRSSRLLRPLLEGSAQAGGASKGAQRARYGLSTLQIALAVILLSEAILLGLSLQHMLKPDPGFASRNLVVAQMTLNGKAYENAKRRKAAWQSLHKAVAALPGIQSAGISMGAPFIFGFRENFYRHHKSSDRAATEKQIVADGIAGETDVLPTLEVKLLAGRLLTQADVVSDAHVAVVDRHFAEALFGTSDVVGKTTNGHRIVGVIAGIDDHFADPSQGTIALPAGAMKWGQFGYLSIVVRSALPPATVARELRGALQHTLPNQSFDEIAPMRHYMGEYAQGTSALATMLIAFGLIAFVLAGVGTYGVIAQATRVRRREFAIRLALGAQTGQIVGLVLRQGAMLWLIGALAGVGLAFAAGRLIRSQLYGIGIWQPIAYLVPVLLLGALVMAASWLPARATLRLDPADALQSE